MLLWLGVVGLDDWLIRNSSLPLLPSFLQVLAVGLPLWFIFTFASRGLSVGSAQRKWGIFDFSLTVTPLTITVLEFLLLLFFGLIIVVALLLQPGSLNNLPSFSQVFQNLNNNPSSSDQLISQFAQQPGMLAGILIMIGLLIPLLEEILKPLGLIVLAGRKPTPSQGFVAGMLCGVAFAFLESSGALAGAAGTEWTTLALTRMGTGLLHITASGLMGWGLASAITLKKKGRFWLAYLCAAGLHGVWNTFAVLMGFFPVLTSDLKPNFKVAAWLGNLAPFVLIAMTVGLVMILVFTNRSIRRQANTPPPLLVPPAANPPPNPPG